MLARCGRFLKGCDAKSEPVDLGGEDEVVVGEALGGVGGEGHRDPAPAQLQVGVVPLRLGEQGDPRGEAEGVAEVAELEDSAQRLVALARPGGIELPLQLGRAVRGQRWGAGSAGGALARGQLRLAHEVLRRPKSRRKNAATAAQNDLSRPMTAVPARRSARIGAALRCGCAVAGGAAVPPDGEVPSAAGAPVYAAA